jgi:aminoglycoside phosphotransferase (APT) family kinase protein
VQVGEGSDHRSFDLNGVFIVRLRKPRDGDLAGDTAREAALLELVSRVSPIPVPEVVAVEPDAGLLVYRRLPGTPLFEHSGSSPLAIAEPLANFVAAIHGIPAGDVEHLVSRDDYAFSHYLRDASGQMQTIAPHLTAPQRRRVERFLAGPVPPESPVRILCHNDLGAEHILANVDRSELTGIIDWSDAALADPARDLGRLLRDFGGGVAAAVLSRTGGDERLMARATFYARCALLEDLAYGIDTSRPPYIAHALGRFAETFA